MQHLPLAHGPQSRLGTSAMNGRYSLPLQVLNKNDKTFQNPKRFSPSSLIEESDYLSRQQSDSDDKQKTALSSCTIQSLDTNCDKIRWNSKVQESSYYLDNNFFGNPLIEPNTEPTLMGR